MLYSIQTFQASSWMIERYSQSKSGQSKLKCCICFCYMKTGGQSIYLFSDLVDLLVFAYPAELITLCPPVLPGSGLKQDTAKFPLVLSYYLA